jgi:signal transduction histidine kinase/DNA-binding response OmpR family regulator
MEDSLSFLENVELLAFTVLGVATLATWLRRRDGSQGWLALAIVLLSSVVLLGRIPILLHIRVLFLSAIEVIAFIGCAYALLRYRASIIPLRTRWHFGALAAMTVASGILLATMFLGSTGELVKGLAAVVTIIVVVSWSVAVGEPIVRFLMVSRGLSALQAWRLRSLSIGFGGVLLILLFALVARSVASTPAVQIALQLVILSIVPFLYLGFSPPAWLRRQWRAAEEERLREFRQDLVLFREDASALADRGLEWAMRLAGAASAVAFTSNDKVLAVRGLDPGQISEIQAGIGSIKRNVNRMSLLGVETNLMVMPIGDGGRLVLVAGPFTPGFGHDEVSRVQQFMSGVMTAVERARLIEKLEQSKQALEQSNQALEQSNLALIEANKHKSVFLASMSHELRTPMNAIIGFSELLIDATDGQFPPATQKRYMELIQTSGKHLLGLINDILDLSKVEAGQMELRLETVSVAGVVEQVVGTIEPLAAQKRVRVEADTAEAGRIEADAAKLKQMLLNLLSNAIKFTPSGGSARIRVRRLARAVEFAVTDTGIGVAEADQARIFNEFQQVDSEVGRKQQGTGLGLSLTRRFARLHGGDVRVESEPGKGSTFTLRMPLVVAQPEKARSAVGTVESHRNGTANVHLPLVLIVDDDASAVDLLVHHLQAAGFRTEVVSTGSEVVQKAQALQPAAITLDVMLPDIDGWEVLKRLKDERTTSSIPVVVVSIVDNRELGISLGAVDCLVKPILAHELVDRLSKFKHLNSANAQIPILVVDDELANRQLAVGILEPNGFKVSLASGGAQAIEMATAQPPAVILLDLMMPEVTGFDVIEALWSRPATHHVPIVVLTAKDLSDADRRYLNSRVGPVLARGSTELADLVALLRETVTNAVAHSVDEMSEEALV